LSPKIDCSALLGGAATPGYQFGLLKKWSKGRQQNGGVDDRNKLAAVVGGCSNPAQCLTSWWPELAQALMKKRTKYM